MLPKARRPTRWRSTLRIGPPRSVGVADSRLEVFSAGSVAARAYVGAIHHNNALKKRRSEAGPKDTRAVRRANRAKANPKPLQPGGWP